MADFGIPPTTGLLMTYDSPHYGLDKWTHILYINLLEAISGKKARCKRNTQEIMIIQKRYQIYCQKLRYATMIP
ncbi:hypothetical protein MTR_4g036610 [Medicago truncatula]|uniref:Uncharacterized protein n=1 Tax=Medicago truncatula TaxID=3880 RepID=A0A072UU93_MEDTR|nr:hypothetical protein MTR_4g036610 [Medicago truncatula]